MQINLIQFNTPELILLPRYCKLTVQNWGNQAIIDDFRVGCIVIYFIREVTTEWKL